MKTKKALTLLELIIVLVVLGLLASFALPSYWGAQQRARNREAEALLRLIRAAEATRFLETQAYVNCADTAACNLALSLDLPVNSWWVYSADGICAQAAHSGTSWCITQDCANVATGSCPACGCT